MMMALNGHVKDGGLTLPGKGGPGKAGMAHCESARLGIRMATRVSLVVSIPIIFLVGITTNVLSQAISGYNAASEASDAVTRAIDLSYVVNKLQIERGLTSLFLSSNRSNLQAYANLMDSRAATALEMFKLGELPVLRIGNLTVWTKDQLMDYVESHRDRADSSQPMISHEENMNFYTAINGAVLDRIAEDIIVPSHDRWLVAFNSLFLARDIAGVKRAIGSTYFGACAFAPGHRKWFTRLEIEFNTYMRFLFRYHPPSEDRYREVLLEDIKLEANLQLYEQRFQDPEYETVCRGDTLDLRQRNSEWWFGNMTNYLNHLAVVMQDLAFELNESLEKIRLKARADMIIYSTVLIFVLFCSAATVYLIYVMTSKMQEFAISLGSKTFELEDERRRTEELLHQMLPPSVADRLKCNQEVPPEFYDMVTIYFSDVVGFTRISALLSPHQVIDFLNALYSLFDKVIDKYDAYKVETIGDAYMVASGLPERNGQEHARQIARMALDIQLSAASFIIPHTEEYIKIRIGLHSGPCASGIVGTKMPRYCLFGDTVNTASRMESTGQECRIHISSNLKSLLDMFGGFACQERGPINVKGKGTITTFWLLGKDEGVKPTYTEPKWTMDLPGAAQ